MSKTRVPLAAATVLLVFAAFLAHAALAMGETLPEAGRIDARTGKQLIDALGQNLLLVDVRTAGEFAQGHIPGAVNIPVEELDKRMAEIPRNVPTLLVCRTGRRAEAACQMLLQGGHGQARLWYLAATPVYGANGAYSFK